MDVKLTPLALITYYSQVYIATHDNKYYMIMDEQSVDSIDLTWCGDDISEYIDKIEGCSEISENLYNILLQELKEENDSTS